MAVVVKGAVVTKAADNSPAIPTLTPLAGAISNNTKPSLGGTGTAGSLITVMDGTKVLGTATVGPDSNWSFAITTALADGLHQFSVKASVTTIGSTATSASTTPFAYTVDTKPPSTPVISTKTSLTNNGKISLAGTAEAASSVKIMDGAVVVATVTADAKGTWSYAPTAAYKDGLHSFTVTATDAAGNVSPVSAASAITIDTSAPDAPTVTTSSLLSNNFKPVLTGTAEAGSTVKVYDNGTALGTAVADAKGQWSFTPTTAFGEGGHAITVRATDTAGNMSVPSSVLNMVTTSKIMSAWGAAETIAGQDGKTMSLRDRASDLAGDKIWAEVVAPTASFATPGVMKADIVLLPQDRIGGLSSTNSITINDVSINNRLGFGAKAFVFPNEDKSLKTFDGALIWIDASNPANSSIMMQNFTFNDFTSLKDAGKITLVDEPRSIADLFDSTHAPFNSFNWDGSSSEFFFQWDQKLSDNSGYVINTVVFDKSGSIISGPSSTDDVYSMSTRWNSKYDPLGNLDLVTLDASAATPTFNILRTSVDQTVTNYQFTPNFAKNNFANTGYGYVWNYTNKEQSGNYLTVEFAVKGMRDGKNYIDFYQTDTDFKILNTSSIQLNTSNSISRMQTLSMANGAYSVFYYQDGATLHLTAIDSKGAIMQDYTQTLAGAPGDVVIDQLKSMGDGRFEISLITKSPAGSNSYGSLVQTQIIDTRTSALTVTGGAGLIAGTSLADTITMSSANAVVEGGAGADKLSATGLNSTLTYEHSGAAVQVDLGKKTAAGGDAAGDTIAGFANLVGSQFADTLTGDAKDNVFTGGLGNDTIVGGGGSDTVVYSGNQDQYTITMNADGSYTVADKRDGTPDGTDKVSGVSNLSFVDKMFKTIDSTKAPVITSKLTLTSNPSTSITGTAIAGSTVGLFDGSALVGTTTADAKGNWVATPLAKLSEGSHTLTAKTVDSGANLSLASNALAFVVDSIAPTKPVFSLDTASDTGLSATDKITNAKAPKIVGTAEAGATVTLFDGATAVGTATVATGSAGGAFTLTSGTLTDGDHTLTVQAKDAAGNVSILSEMLKVTIDTKAPDAPVLPTLDAASDTGVSSVDGITKTAIPVINGVAEAGSKVELFDGTKSVGTATAAVDGKYAITASTLTDGVHKLTVKATDLAGNTSAASAVLSVTTDTVGPAVPVITTMAGSVSTNAPTIAGTAEANSTVTLYNAANAIGSVTADATGKWSYTVTNLLADGTYQFSAQAIDIAGNASNKSAAVAVTVDTVAPDKPNTLALTAASDTGLSATDGITKLNTPTVTGKAEAGSTVTLYEGTTVLGTGVAGSTGVFSITSSKLLDGNHVLAAKAVDAAGNVSLLSTSLNISVVTTVPDAPVIKTSGATSTATPTIEGTAKALTTVTVLDGTTVLGTAAVDMQGAWSFVVPDGVKLTEGAHNITATAGDTAGNVSKPSAVAALTVNLKPIEVTIDQLGKYAGSSNVGSFSVKDTAANIAKNLDTLAATKSLFQIIQTDTPKSVDITATQYNADLAVFAKFRSNYGLTVTGATIVDADVLQKDSHVLSFQISETLSNIKSNFDSLNTKVDLWKNLNTTAPILIKDAGNLAVTAAQYTTNTNIKALLPAATTYEISDVQTDSAGLPLSKNANIASIKVADTVAAITADLDKLNAAANIKSISFTDPTPSALAITYSQLGADVAVLAKLPSSYQLVVKDVPAAAIATVSANTHVISMSVVDSTANLLSLINADPKGIDGKVVDPKISTITIDETKPSASGSTPTTPVAGISIADAMKIAALPNLAAVPSFKILDTAANIVAHARYDILNVIAHSTKITISDLPPKLTVADAKLLNDFSAFQISNGSLALAGSAGGSVALSSGTLTPIASSAGGTFTLTSGTVTGTVTAAGSAGSFTITSGTLTQAGKALAITGGSMSVVAPSHVDASGNPLITGFTYTLSDANTTLLEAGNADLVKSAKSVTAIHTYTVADALKLQAPVLLTSPIAIDDTAANIIAQSKVAGDLVISRAVFVIVTDTTAKVGAAIDDLEALAKKGQVTDIKLTDTGVTPSLTATQLANDYDAIGRIIGLSINTSTTSLAYAAPTLMAPTLTNNKQPTLTGTAKPGATVTVYDGTTKLGTATADTTGLWNYKISTDLTEATHTFTATASLMDGSRVSAASNAVAMQVDATAPSAPTLVLPTLSVPGLTKNALPTLTGTAEKSSSVSIYDGTSVVATVTAGALGTWSYTFNKALSDGDHSLKAVATDLAGNASAASSIAVLTVDTLAPTAPVITSISNSNAPMSTDITNNQTQVYWDTSIGGNGHIYEYVNTDVTWDDALLLASQKSIGGFQGYLVTITSKSELNFIGQNMNKISVGWDARDIWTSLSDSVTEGTWKWMAGPEVGSTQDLRVFGFPDSTYSGWQPNVDWMSITTGYKHDTLGIMPTDQGWFKGGLRTSANSSAYSRSFYGNGYVIEYGGLAGNLSNITSQNTKPTISGTAEKGSLVNVYDGIKLLGTTTASSTDGKWSLTLTTALAIGAHSITATAKDIAGNVSATSTASVWTVPDTTPQPVATSLKWSADQLNGYEFSATTGNKKASSATVSETVSLVAGATYTFAAGYGYSYSGSAPTVSLKVLDAANNVVGSSSTPVNGYTFTAATTGVYTVQVAAINATNTAQLTSYNLSGHQAMSTMPATSGDTNVDALLMGGTGQWWHTPGSLATVSTSTADVIHTGLSSLTAASAQHTLTYSFLTSLPATASASDKLGFAAMSAVQQTAVKKALDYISTLIDVKFTLATTAGQGDINFGQNNQSGSAGYANPPYQGGGNPSYLMLASNASTNSDFSVGSYGWETLIHEIGHTLGLKHPGNYNAGGGGTPGPYLPADTDTRRYTVMSYNNPTDSTNVTAKTTVAGVSYSWTSINPQSFMLYDIEALQYLYGSNKTTGYQTVTFAADYKGMQTIWAPTGGKIDASAMTLSNLIDLRAGYFSSIGIQGPTNLPASIAGNQTYTGMNNVAIAYGSAINDAVGGSANDVFYVNKGNDNIDGGAGTDVVYLYGSAGDWTITETGTTKVAVNKTTSATETLKNIETISYYDPGVATLTHTAPTGSLSQTVSAFVQSVAAMAGQGSASTVIPTNGGMTLQQVMTVTKPV